MANQNHFSAIRRTLLGAVSAFSIFTAIPTVTAQQDREISISLPQQPLSQALVSIGKQFNVTVVAPADLVRGFRSPSVSGTLTIEVALARALANTDFVASSNDEGSYVIKPGREEEASQDRQYNAIEEIVVREEIIVTGTKRNTNIQNVLESVAVLTDEAIDEQVVYDLADALQRIPNVNLSPGNLFNIQIRGINTTGAAFAGNGRTLNIYVDGVPASREGTTGTFNFWDVGQVEVLRGPQATTQGRNALAGAVIIRTLDPEYDFSATARALVGSQNTYQFSGTVTGGIIEDQLAFRLAADYREQNFDTFNAVINEPRGFNDQVTLRGKLLAEPENIPGLRAILNVQYTDRTGEGNASGVAGPSPNSPEFENYDPFSLVTFDGRAGINESEAIRYILDVDYQLNDNWRLEFLGSYEDINRDIINTLDSVDERRDDTYQAELRAVFDYDGVSGWVGGYYFDETTDFFSILNFNGETFGFQTQPADALISSASQRTSNTENIAVFGEVVVDLTENFSLNFGARYDFEDVFDTGITGETTISDGGCAIIGFFAFPIPCDVLVPIGGTDEPDFNDSFSAFLPKAALQYSFNDDVSVAAIVSRGYRAGGVDTVNILENDVTISQFEQFDPEFLWNYELAFRSQWLDQRLTVNANLFYSDYTNQQVRVPIPFSIDQRTVNAGTSELYGLELSTDYQISSALNVYGSLGLLETEFTDFPFATQLGPDGELQPLPNIPQFFNLAGNEFASAPNVTASFGGAYNSASGFFASFNASYTGEQFSDIENLAIDAVDGFWLVNARVGYQLDRFKVSVFANNLFDKRAFTSLNRQAANTAGNGSLENSVIQIFNFTPPAFYGFEIEMNF